MTTLVRVDSIFRGKGRNLRLGKAFVLIAFGGVCWTWWPARGLNPCFLKATSRSAGGGDRSLGSSFPEGDFSGPEISTRQPPRRERFRPGTPKRGLSVAFPDPAWGEYPQDPVRTRLLYPNLRQESNHTRKRVVGQFDFHRGVPSSEPPSPNFSFCRSAANHILWTSVPYFGLLPLIRKTDHLHGLHKLTSMHHAIDHATDLHQLPGNALELGVIATIHGNAAGFIAGETDRPARIETVFPLHQLGPRLADVGRKGEQEVLGDALL